MQGGEKLVILAGLSRLVYSRWLLPKMLMGTIIVAGLIVVLGMLASALLIGGLCAVYEVFVYYGVAPHLALLAVLGIIVLIVAAVAITIRVQLRRLKEMPRRLLRRSVVSRVAQTTDAFLNGLLAD